MRQIQQTRTILAITGSLFAASVVGFSIIFAIAEQGSAARRAEDAARDMAHVVEEYAKRTFETSDLIARDVVTYVLQRGGTEAVRDDPATYRFLEETEKSSGTADYLLVVDKEGIPVSLTTSFPAPRTSLGDRPWFRAHRDGAVFHVGTALFSRITREILFTYSRRVTGDDGGFLGAVQVSMRLGFLDDFASSSALAREMVFGLWNLDGQVIARSALSPREIDTVQLDPHVAAAMEVQRGGLILNGGSVLAWRRVPGWPVVVTASLPLTAIQPSLLWSWGPFAVLGMLGSILALTILGLRASRRAAQSLDAERAANESLSRALADKELLLKEIHHRVKNNLQITGSLLRMQSRRFKDKEIARAFEETQERLHAISLVHETLYQRDLEPKVDLPDYLGRLVNDLSATYTDTGRHIGVSLSVEPLALSIDRAVPLGLILNEVVTNAYRHAFPHGSDGIIEIAAARTGSEIEVTVRDSGQGFAGTQSRTNSLGMRLIEAFTRQLGGRFNFSAQNGTLFRLTFPPEA